MEGLRLSKNILPPTPLQAVGISIHQSFTQCLTLREPAETGMYAIPKKYKIH